MLVKNQSNIVPSLASSVLFDISEDGALLISNTKHCIHAQLSRDAFILLNSVDGNRSIEEIINFVTNNAPTKEDIANITSFIVSEIKRGIFITNLKNNHNAKSTKSINILSSKTISSITKKLHWTFSKEFVLTFYLFFCIVSACCFIGIINIPQESNGVNNYWITISCSLLIVILHEVGHCTALSIYGLKTNGIGMELYLLIPVVYSDVSNAWRLSNKKRMVVDAGGFHFQAVTTLLLLCVSIVTASREVYEAVIFSLVLFCFNINPFIKSDGYWIACDFFNIENLQQAAYKGLRDIVTKKGCQSYNIWLIVFAVIQLLILVGIYSSFIFECMGLLNRGISSPNQSVISFVNTLDFVEWEYMAITLIYTYILLKRILNMALPYLASIRLRV